MSKNDTLQLISERIESLDGRIALQRDSVYEADIACKAKEYRKKVQENLAIFKGKVETKLTDLTAKANAVVATETLGNEELLAEAQYIREKGKLEKLVDERDTLRARENNLRAEHRLGYGA